MIDNHSDAWPQFSINKAYAVYEIIVEGGETRLMAVFKGSDADKSRANEKFKTLFSRLCFRK